MIQHCENHSCIKEVAIFAICMNTVKGNYMLKVTRLMPGYFLLHNYMSFNILQTLIMNDLHITSIIM
jgi:hypothetical protein